MQDNLTLYTQQAQIVLDTIERNGVSRVKREYIDQKYGSESWVFRQAYTFFAQYAPEYVPKPEDAESGIWCFFDSRWAAAAPGGSMLELSVPRNCAVVFDSRVWNRMLNLQYVPLDEQDEAAFESRLASMGIRQSSEAFSTAFYPTIKREIVTSWQRLFKSADNCPETYLQAGIWEIRKEWVVNIVPYADNTIL